MIIFICTDNKNGILFNRRRQSRDEAVLKDILETAGEKIWMNAYSAKLFSGYSGRIVVEEDFLECAPLGSSSFAENIPLKPYEDRMERLEVYQWNREYPADAYLDLDLSRDWEVMDQKEFRGTSHEKITRKIYKRKIC